MSDWRQSADRELLAAVPDGGEPTAEQRVANAARIIRRARERFAAHWHEIPADILDLDYDLLCALRSLGPLLPAEAPTVA